MIDTGLIRKIDGMGRLVIPKEIRERYNIREDDYLEFSLTNDGFCLKKYSKLGRLQMLAQELTDTLNMFLDAEVLIAERDTILAYSGMYKDKYLNKPVSDKLIQSIKRRESLFETYTKELHIIEDDIINCSYINETIVANSEEIGIICLYRLDRSVDKTDLKVVNIVSSFLTKYIEE